METIDILLLEPLIAEAMAWLEGRHSISVQPKLASDERALRHKSDNVRAIVVPREVKINQEFLDFAPKLEVVSRLVLGRDNIDVVACQKRNVKLVLASSANVRAQAEFVLAALLAMFRPGFVPALAGQKPAPLPRGREINGATIGMLGLPKGLHAITQLVSAMGARLIGYDPTLHHNDPVWQQLRVQPVSLTELMSLSDAVSVQMEYASRYTAFINDRMLAACKRNQVWVSISRSDLFDLPAVLQAMDDGRISALWIDGPDQKLLENVAGLKNYPHFYVTHRLGSHTHEARARASWYVAHRLHEALELRNPSGQGVQSPMMLELPGENSSLWGDSRASKPASVPPSIPSSIAPSPNGR